MEASIFSLLDPISPKSALKTGSWPVPGILRLDDVELTVESKSHGRVANVGASTIHDDWIEAIKSHDGDEVT